MKNSEKYLNRVTNKGITLIALVISVVVILILLTITINLALGDRGLLTESEGTKKDSIVSLYEKEIAAKIVKREVIEEITDAILEEILSNYGDVQYDEEGSPSGVVTKEGYLIEIEYIWNGKVKVKVKTEEEMKAEYPTITQWIPIYTRAQLEKVGSGQIVAIEQEDGTEYTFKYGATIGYILKNDIDLSEGDFSPLPNLTAGVFLGNDKIITNITINSSEQYVGLFKQNSGTISYLKIKDSNITLTSTSSLSIYCVGGITGSNSGTITNCYNTGAITGTSTSTITYIGGITGDNSGTITNCYNTGSITGISTSGSKRVGGITGNNSGTITKCYNTGAITGTANQVFAGGIVGYNDSGTITNCYNTGSITGTSTSTITYIGGITGRNYGTITNCYNTGSIITYGTYVGGIVGYNNSGGTITNCYNTGTMTVTLESSTLAASRMAGGIVGYNDSGTITSCFNTGAITGEVFIKYIGGITGYNTGTITKCYNTGEVTSTTSTTWTNIDINVGGIAGHNASSGTITNSYNTGAITGTTSPSKNTAYVGGITGRNSGTITNCYDTGTIIDPFTPYITYLGGIAGYNTGTLTNCYNTGELKSTSSYVKGIVGRNVSGTLTNCYYLTGTTADSNATEKTSDELKVLAPTLGTDWKTDTNNINNGYPILSWQ